MSKRTKLAVVLILLSLVGLWAHGTFDRVLSNVGLQAHECARNGLGATFCGKELDEYRARISRAKQEGEEGAAKIKEDFSRAQRKVTEEQAAIQRKGEEEQAKITREGEEAQQRIQEQSGG